MVRGGVVKSAPCATIYALAWRKGGGVDMANPTGCGPGESTWRGGVETGDPMGGGLNGKANLAGRRDGILLFAA